MHFCVIGVIDVHYACSVFQGTSTGWYDGSGISFAVVVVVMVAC